MVGRGPDVIDNPESPALQEFYAQLVRHFHSGEVEPLAWIQAELAANPAPAAAAQFFGVVLRDPGAAGRIVSSMYGSVHDGVLALRFKFTEPRYRSIGISQAADRFLFDEACRRAGRLRRPLWACFGECVEKSEAYLNRAWGIRRLYVPDGPGGRRELYYELPHLGRWTPGGEPIDPAPAPVREHLQVAAAPYPTAIPVAVLRDILLNVWGHWYVLPPGWFDGPAAWERHRDRVMRILNERILAPLRPHPAVTPLSREERERLKRSGVAVRDLVLDA